jgi:hypothetical protein
MRNAADSHDVIRVQGARVNVTGKHLAAFVGNNR